MMGINPIQFFTIKDTAGGIDTLKTKLLNKLFHRENFLIAVGRPADHSQIIYQTFQLCQVGGSRLGTQAVTLLYADEASGTAAGLDWSKLDVPDYNHDDYDHGGHEHHHHHHR